MAVEVPGVDVVEVPGVRGVDGERGMLSWDTSRVVGSGSSKDLKSAAQRPSGMDSGIRRCRFGVL